MRRTIRGVPRLKKCSPTGTTTTMGNDDDDDDDDNDNDAGKIRTSDHRGFEAIDAKASLGFSIVGVWVAIVARVDLFESYRATRWGQLP